MSANISIFNGRAEFAYVGASPWWGIGNGSLGEEGVSGARILTAAHLDWTVSTRPVFAQTTEGGDIDIAVPRLRVICRDDNHEVLGWATEAYQPIQNIQGADVLDALVGEGAKFEIAGALGKGERVWCLAKLGENFEVLKGDEVEQRILVCWGHDGQTKLFIKVTPTRVVCHNTLALALKGGGASVGIKHYAGASLNIADVRDALHLVVKQGAIAKDAFMSLAAKPVTGSQVRDYTVAVFPKPVAEANGKGYDEKLARWSAVQERVLSLYEAGKGADIPGVRGTAWGAYNAVTEYVDHVYPVLSAGKGAALTRRVSSVRQESALFGAYADLKADALDLALAI